MQLFRPALIIVLCFSCSAFGFDKDLVTADPANVDEDFAFQGEYAGLILPMNKTSYRKVGVQVVAKGDGQFDAVCHQFGLPGAGWNRSERATLHGRREGDLLTLTGSEYYAEVRNGQMVLKAATGETLGGFPRRIRTSPTLGKRAPGNAIVLFDGTSTDHFTNGRISDAGLLMEGADFKDLYSDFDLHLEFRTPYMPGRTSQKRGNSGVYILSRYEVQILDSFGLEGAFNECGALYRYQPPAINMALPPLQWQTYDITFRSARFDADGKKIQNARITVRHNGVAVHDDFEIERKTGAGKKESAELFPIRLQNHSDPVRFRNIWLIDRS